MTPLQFNTQRALQYVGLAVDKYMHLPEDKVAALLVRHWPDTMASQRHPYRDGQEVDEIWTVDPRTAGMSEDDISAIQGEFMRECNIMMDALRNTPSYDSIAAGYCQAESRLVHAHALTGELYSYPSRYIVVPTVQRIHGRALTVMMTYSYQELMPLLQQPPSSWSQELTDMLRQQFRLDMALYAITPR